MSGRDHFFEGIIIGALTGAILGILYAPQSGDKTREKIKHIRDENEDIIQDSKEHTENMIEKTKDAIEEGFEKLSHMIENARGKAS